ARGGSVVVAYPYEPSTLNPFVPGGDSPATRDLVRPLMPALYRIGPKGARAPWLLAAEPSTADVGGSPWGVRLRLRADAVWSDGAPITANDLRFTWKAVTTSPGVATRDPYDRVKDVVVEAPDLARRSFAARRGSQVTSDRGATWVGLFLNTQGLVLSDVHVRQAIARSLDRPAIAEGLVREWGEELDAPSAGDGLRTAPTFDR